MQLAVEMWPSSMSATGLPRDSIAASEVQHVATDGRGDVLLQVFLGLVLGIFLELETTSLWIGVPPPSGMKS